MQALQERAIYDLTSKVSNSITSATFYLSSHKSPHKRKQEVEKQQQLQQQQQQNSAVKHWMGKLYLHREETEQDQLQ